MMKVIGGIGKGKGEMTWIRTCQECRHKQVSKPPAEYKGEWWQNIKCRRCQSIALDYDKEEENDSS